MDVRTGARNSIDGLPALSYSHPRFQEAAFTWAGSQGATLIRPAKAIGVTRAGGPCLTVLRDGVETEYRARLIVGADGKLSAARSWFGAETVADPETHKFGGVLVSGVRMDDRGADCIGDPPAPDPSAPPVQGPVDVRVNWFAISADMTRLYLHGRAARLRELGIDRSFDALVAAADRAMPEGAMDDAKSEGPIGFFPNNNIWSSKVAGDDVVLIGDAAGAPDPSRMGGTALLFRDIRELSELLLSDRDWPGAIAEYAVRRTRYYEVIRESDRWEVLLKYGVGEAADRAREGNTRAKAADPTLGGIAMIEVRGARWPRGRRDGPTDLLRGEPGVGSVAVQNGGGSMALLHPIPMEEIEAARARTSGVALRTPLVRFDADDIVPAGSEIFLKLECLQPVRSFKLRGAYNAMAKVGREALPDGVWTVSSGNMAQAVAWSARALGVPCTVYVPDYVPRSKVANVHRYGGATVERPMDELAPTFLTGQLDGAPGRLIHPYKDRRRDGRQRGHWPRAS